MEVFITGASGFVGGAALRHLVSSGLTVKAMSRRADTDKEISALGGEPVRCDLDTVTGANIGAADAVIHCAAFVEQWGPRDAWQKVNVAGTQNLIAAARAAGVQRFIHIGTEAALVHGQHLDDVDETYPLAPGSPYPYCATKAQAEALVRSANGDGFQTIVLRPRLIWGPGDTTLLPAIEQMASNGAWVWIDHGRARTSSTHIDNLCHAIHLALERGGGGEAYFILDDGTRSLREIISGMAEAAGLELGKRSIPTWLADMAGAACELAWRGFRLKGLPPLTRHAAMVMSRRCTLNDARARRDLGYTPVTSYEQGMEALATSLRTSNDRSG